jgi:predicted GIY-YIG superfamily endonuclease
MRVLHNGFDVGDKYHNGWWLTILLIRNLATHYRSTLSHPTFTYSIITIVAKIFATMTTPVTTDPLASHDSIGGNASSATIPVNTSSDKPRWTRLNYKGIYHDNRRLLQHRAKNCECFVCYREIYKLPPMETHHEYVTAVKTKIQEREIKKAIRNAKKEVKNGKQGSIKMFLAGSLP